MTLGRTRSVAVTGIDGTLVAVEADVASGLPAFTVSGLPDTACAQSPDRVRAAASNCGLALPRQRITVNLSPASLPKQGAGFDLAIAVAVLAAGGTVPTDVVADVVHLGELGLDGTVRPVHGVLPAVLAAVDAGARIVVVPLENAAEAALVEEVDVVPVRRLDELVARYVAIARGAAVSDPEPPVSTSGPSGAAPDLADVAGQPEARFALEVAAAGGHHIAMTGPPGAGKTMIAERLPGLLPALSRAEALQVTAIHSVLGALPDAVLVDRPPFVSPHHGASMAAIIGGGSGRVRPGAVSRACCGVLFLDEAPEFRRDVLDALRQPLESGRVSIARADRNVSYPARFQLVLAANPCPCGRAYGKGTGCVCSPRMRRAYLARLSGPLLDRVDLQLTVHPVTKAALRAGPGESSAAVAERVALARARQERRWAGHPWRLNSHVPGPVLRSGAWRLDRRTTDQLDRALERGGLTLRGYDRVLRIAWSLADLADLDRPGSAQLMQALCLRSQTAEAA
ncbi:YifB family Mg chelatase-like AAA ATPase [Luteipulveratus sp. YIM 133132]|uniref:YifB family Mg chelatase-like AAA ATPase n=1 Tax=Luteipulveratus flavus TaxID=3031728 RepID=UPI0023AF18C7|nr:YifB family Mg chelatase-like AAA ATPase [Luteipulveratus sp. YIM 133132]MDE9367900.1 YifB family Mg chelatase-like AAA ATPase [Luteipulveratus sp. YIM 133132]